MERKCHVLIFPANITLYINLRNVICCLFSASRVHSDIFSVFPFILESSIFSNNSTVLLVYYNAQSLKWFRRASNQPEPLVVKRIKLGFILFFYQIYRFLGCLCVNFFTDVLTNRFMYFYMVKKCINIEKKWRSFIPIVNSLQVGC